MENDWDLFAIVRSCSAIVAAPAADSFNTKKKDDDVDETAPDNTTKLKDDGLKENNSFSFPILVDSKNEYDDPFDELQYVYKPFYPRYKPQSITIPLDDSGVERGANKIPLLQERKEEKLKKSQLIDAPTIATPESQNQFQLLQQRQLQVINTENHNKEVCHGKRIPVQAPRRRRKKKQKMVVRISREMLSNDVWSWRKYGQKPIKDSPHPRSYYRCSSSSAGCPARKQVELSEDNPDDYIVCYIGDHSHPRPIRRRFNFGATRKPPSTCSTSPAATPLIPPDDENQHNDAEDEEEDDDILIPNTLVSEDIFMAMHSFKPRESASTSGQSQSPDNNSINSSASS